MADVSVCDRGCSILDGCTCAPDEVEDLRLETVNGTARPWPEGAFGSGGVNQEFEAMILQEIAQNHTAAMIEAANEREAAWAE